MSDPEREHAPATHLLTVTYDGTTIQLPCTEAEVNMTLVSLYRQFKRDNGRSFEVRDPSGRLIATASRMSAVPTENVSDYFDTSDVDWGLTRRKRDG